MGILIIMGKQKALMVICDHWISPDGDSVISGINQQLRVKSNSDIVDMIGESILITRNGVTLFQVSVKSVEISDSLIGFKNIHIHIPSNMLVTRDVIGCAVYAI